MSKHTPGPWKILGPKPSRDPDMETMDCAIECSPGGPGHIIAEVFGRSGEKKFHDAYANARLMHAAPEMLEALKAAQSKLCEHCPQYMAASGEQVGDHTDECIAAMDAIKKAEGEGS